MLGTQPQSVVSNNGDPVNPSTPILSKEHILQILSTIEKLQKEGVPKTDKRYQTLLQILRSQDLKRYTSQDIPGSHVSETTTNNLLGSPPLPGTIETQPTSVITSVFSPNSFISSESQPESQISITEENQSTNSSLGFLTPSPQFTPKNSFPPNNFHASTSTQFGVVHAPPPATQVTTIGNQSPLIPGTANGSGMLPVGSNSQSQPPNFTTKSMLNTPSSMVSTNMTGLTSTSIPTPISTPVNAINSNSQMISTPNSYPIPTQTPTNPSMIPTPVPIASPAPGIPSNPINSAASIGTPMGNPIGTPGVVQSGGPMNQLSNTVPQGSIFSQRQMLQFRAQIYAYKNLVNQRSIPVNMLHVCRGIIPDNLLNVPMKPASHPVPANVTSPPTPNTPNISVVTSTPQIPSNPSMHYNSSFHSITFEFEFLLNLFVKY